MATRLLTLLVRLPAAPTALLMAGIVGRVESAFWKAAKDRQEEARRRNGDEHM
jgi:hypothetical protein